MCETKPMASWSEVDEQRGSSCETRARKRLTAAASSEVMIGSEGDETAMAVVIHLRIERGPPFTALMNVFGTTTC